MMGFCELEIFFQLIYISLPRYVWICSGEERGSLFLRMYTTINLPFQRGSWSFSTQILDLASYSCSVSPYYIRIRILESN